MNNLEIFQTPEFGTVRTVIREDAPWFVAADVCRILGLDQVSRAMDRLDDRQRSIIRMRYFENMSQREVAERLNVSQMTISREERKALEIMKKQV